MTDVVDFEAEREKRLPHLSGTMQCLACGDVHVAVAPIGVLETECPACGLTRAVWRGPIRPPKDTRIYQCECGSVFFYLTENYPMCMRCGICREWPKRRDGA